MSLSSAPFIDLFDRLREAGMALTYPQYEKFTQALFLPGLVTCDNPWERVKSYGRWLWVKPSSRFDQVTYERVFEQYRQSFQGQLLDIIQDDLVEPSQVAETVSESFQAGHLPVKPPKQDWTEAELPETKDDSTGEVVTAMGLPQLPQLLPKPHAFIVESQDLPITGTQLVEYWQISRTQDQRRVTRRMDLIQFRRRLIRTYPDYQIYFQLQRQHIPNLILLVDTALGMRPFMPWIESLIKGIENDLVSYGHIFYFLHFPKTVLYPRSNPSRGIGLDTDQLSSLFHSQTIVLIVSEAGTVRRESFPERIEGMKCFLSQIASKVATIVTFNPMPRDTWEGTCAEALKDCPDHQMWSLDSLTPERMETVFYSQSLMEVG